jgi:hypothetical protein
VRGLGCVVFVFGVGYLTLESVYPYLMNRKQVTQTNRIG